MPTIEEILKAPNMQGTIQAVKSGVPNPFDPALLTTTAPVDGDYGVYRKVDGNRQLAQRVAYGSPSKNVTLLGVSEVPVKLIHTFENVRHKPAVMNNLLSDNAQRQLLGEQEIGRQTQEFKARFMNLRISSVASALALGAVYFNADGQLLSSSSGAAVTIDYGIPAGNKNQLDYLNDGNAIIDGDWDTAATKIVSQMNNLKEAAVKLSGYPIETAYYGKNIIGYLAKNTEMLSFTARVPAMAADIAMGVIPDGLLGIPKWRSAGTHMWEDESGDITTVWNDNGITFVPATDRTWWDMLEGSIPVPNNLGAITEDGIAALANISTVRGIFNYAHVTSDPVGIKHLAGDTMLPVIKAVKAVWMAVVSGF